VLVREFGLGYGLLANWAIVRMLSCSRGLATLAIDNGCLFEFLLSLLFGSSRLGIFATLRIDLASATQHLCSSRLCSSFRVTRGLHSAFRSCLFQDGWVRERADIRSHETGRGGQRGCHNVADVVPGTMDSQCRGTERAPTESKRKAEIFDELPERVCPWNVDAVDDPRPVLRRPARSTDLGFG
jgi:hypothetical protein